MTAKSCRYIGTWKELHHWQDLYLCGDRGRHSQIVVVRNNDPADTFGFMECTLEATHARAELSCGMRWGLELAKSKGLL